MWLSLALVVLQVIKQILDLTGPEARLRRLEERIAALKLRQARAQVRLIQREHEITQQPDLEGEALLREMWEVTRRLNEKPKS